jgi:hypothetical protein
VDAGAPPPVDAGAPAAQDAGAPPADAGRGRIKLNIPTKKN